jgi:hypothetical protein
MPLKIEVKDRVATYPGRVKLTPVNGETNLYDMERADSPIENGTPIDKALFDNKLYTLTSDVTVYVSKSGNDLSGNGSYDLPYATVQKAVDSIPLHLGGFTARIDIANGTYEERVSVVGFSGGSLVIGIPGRSVTLRGIEIIESSHVTTNISNITYATGFTGPLYKVDKGSTVLIGSNMTINGMKASMIGVSASNGSNLNTYTDVTLSISDCYNAAVVSEFGSVVAVDTVVGTNNSMGLVSTKGSLLSYIDHTLEGAWGDVVSAGSIMVTGGNSSEFVNSTVI